MVRFQDLEIWDYPPGYNNYKVSSKGQVWSTGSGKILKPRIRNDGYYQVFLYKDRKRKGHLVHNLVANTFYFAEDYAGYQIDHVDRDKGNNNLLNLRFCTGSENCRNRAVRSDSASGLKGVHFDKKHKKWRAYISADKKRKYLGYFETKEEAYNAYKRASKEDHGEYAYSP